MRGALLRAPVRRLFGNSNAVENGSVPWYLRPEESPALNSPLTTVEIPQLPDNAPGSLLPILEFVGNELGMQNLRIFDLKASNSNEGAADMASYMVLGTGKSPKHIQKATSELNVFIKHNYKQLVATEGILRAGIVAKYNRRLQKKGKKAPAYAQNDFGASPNTWVMTDCKCDGIVVHFMTKERREDLNLEDLWAPEEAPVRASKSPLSDDIFKGVRYFSTARVLAQGAVFDPTVVTFDNYENHFKTLCQQHLTDSNETSIHHLEMHLNSMQRIGFEVTVPLVDLLTRVVTQSSEFHKGLQTANMAFHRRFAKLDGFISKYQPQLTDDGMLQLMPTVLAMGSQFDHPNFSTPSNLKQQLGDPLMYSHNMDALYLEYERITSAYPEQNQFLNITMLTIYANGLNWFKFEQVVQKAIATDDVQVLRVATILMAHLGDPVHCANFRTNYLPLLEETNDIQNHIDNIVRKSYT